MRSIDRFGMLDALIINVASGRKFVLIGGHMRLAALKALGYKEVPVVFVDIPDIEKEKELNIRLNANTGSWDIDLLKDLGIDILTKADFDCGEIDGMFNDVLTIEDDEFDVAKELEKIKEPKAKEGDHYLLGKHHLICGDSTNPEVVKKVTDGTQIDMINSDSPYNIKLNYNKGIGTKGKYGATKCNDNKSDTEYRKFLKTTLSNGLSVCKKDAHIFYWCDQKYFGMIQDIYAELGINFKRVCLWIKNSSNPTPQIAFNKCYEPCVYGITGKPYLSKSKNFSEILNKEIDSGNRTIDDILDLLDIWLVKRLPTTTYEHPTSKPPSLYEKALRRCSKPGDAVLDLFGGSGSQLIACEQLKRICYMVELDPVFIDLIINRYEKLTGQKSRKLN
jgi:DNA modification methylase